jgi:N-acetylmuramoyl-L-alanine amidase
MSLLKERYSVILTRSDDSAVPIDERTAIANRHRADLFISIHAKPGTTGDTTPSVFYHLPVQEPGRGLPEGSWEASQLPHLPRSRSAAEAICKALSPRTRSGDCALGAPIAVLAGAAMPAILVEPFSLGGFPEIRAAIAERLQKHALDLARGIDAFFGQEAPGP